MLEPESITDRLLIRRPKDRRDYRRDVALTVINDRHVNNS